MFDESREMIEIVVLSVVKIKCVKFIHLKYVCVLIK